MWLQFFYQNLHFTINLFSALVVFAVFWLYFDAWLEKKRGREIPRLVGYLVLALSFLAHATAVESNVIQSEYFGTELGSNIAMYLRIVGYSVVAVGLLLEPLQKRPDVKPVAVPAETAKPKLKAKVKSSKLFLPWFVGVGTTLPMLPAVLSLCVAILYWRRATIGIERHVRPVAIAFSVIFFAELMSAASLLRSSTNVEVSRLVAPFGFFWVVEHLILFLGVILLGRWVWQYLLQRVQTQLFMMLTATYMVVFVVVTVSFTALLARNLQFETFDRLATDVGVLQYSLEQKHQQVLADTQTLAQNLAVKDGLHGGDLARVIEVAQTHLLGKQLDSVLVLGPDGQVKVRAEDPDQIGGSLSENTLVRRALLGEELVTNVVSDGILVPVVAVSAVVPIWDGSDLLGIVMAQSKLDNLFVDRLEEVTGLRTAIYAGNTVSATTQLASDGVTRQTGVMLTDQTVAQTVLGQGLPFTGVSTIMNVPSFVSYSPLQDVNGVTVGMLSVAKPQIQILQTMNRSIELTFVFVVVLILLTMYPVYLISRYISGQLR